jgi:hypothetical protein
MKERRGREVRNKWGAFGGFKNKEFLVIEQASKWCGFGG